MSETAAEGGCEEVGEMESDYKREQWLLPNVDLRGTEYLVDVERRQFKGFLKPNHSSTQRAGRFVFSGQSKSVLRASLQSEHFFPVIANNRLTITEIMRWYIRFAYRGSIVIPICLGLCVLATPC